MNYNYRYRLQPSDALEERLTWTVDTCRQVYNHFLHRPNRVDDTSSYSEQKRLPDLRNERERLERAHRNLSRKEHGSNNSEEQRKSVARRHADLRRKRRDLLHKVSNYYAREYDLVAVEDLDAKGLVELPGNSRNRAGAA